MTARIDSKLYTVLEELDKKVSESVRVVGFGGTALTFLKLKERTYDVDICLNSKQTYLEKILKEIGRDKRIIVDIVYDGFLYDFRIPDFNKRIIGPIEDLPFNFVKIYFLHPVDVILSKITRYQTRDEWDIEIALKQGKFKESDFDERFDVFFNNYIGKSPLFFKKRYEMFKQQFGRMLR